MAMAPVIVPTASLYDSWWNAIIGKFFTIVERMTDIIYVEFFLNYSSFGSRHFSNVCTI